MADPTLGELVARVAAIEARLGITPTPTPVPTPTKPAAPTGLRATTLSDGRIQLDWDPAPSSNGVDSWDVLDLANLAAPLKDTVTTPRSIRTPLKAGDKRTYVVQARNAAGLSPVSNVVYLPAPPAPTPVPPPAAKFPADIVGKRWYLTTPVARASDGLAEEIYQPTLAQYVSKYFELDAAGTGTVFRAWHGGATTKGSKNSRSELREMGDEVGKVKANWSTTAGRHRMVVEGQVNRLTKVRPHVVIAQIHDATDDVSMWRVEGDKLWLTDGDNPHGYLVDQAFKLGQRYRIGYDVSGGVISYVYNGRPIPWTKSIAATGCYFKCGAYLQSNATSAPGESTSEYAEVVIFSVEKTHA